MISNIRKIRNRRKLNSRSTRVRLIVNRSARYLYAALMDPVSGKTVAGVRGKDPSQVGKSIGQKGIKSKIKEVVFDRGPYSYHGRVKALAEAAREAGLKF